MNQTCFALFLFFRLFRRRLPPLITHLASPSTVLCTSLVQLDFFFSCIHTRLRLLLRSGLHFTRHLVAIIVRNNDLTVSVLFFFFLLSRYQSSCVSSLNRVRVKTSLDAKKTDKIKIISFSSIYGPTSRRNSNRKVSPPRNTIHSLSFSSALSSLNVPPLFDKILKQKTLHYFITCARTVCL